MLAGKHILTPKTHTWAGNCIVLQKPLAAGKAAIGRVFLGYFRADAVDRLLIVTYVLG